MLEIFRTLMGMNEVHEETKFIFDPEVYWQPMYIFKDRRNVFTSTSVRDESSSCVLYSLKRLNCRLRQSSKCSIAVVESAEY